eukprot:15329226-Ditylum_brightwellii.AAC.1
MPEKQANNKHGKSSHNKQKNPAGPKKLSKMKSIQDSVFYIGSSKQASDFKMTYKYVINHIKMTFERGNDIAEMLRNLRRPDLSHWRPTLSVSTNANADVKSQENKQFKMEFKAELDKMMKRKR